MKQCCIENLERGEGWVPVVYVCVCVGGGGCSAESQMFCSGFRVETWGAVFKDQRFPLFAKLRFFDRLVVDIHVGRLCRLTGFSVGEDMDKMVRSQCRLPVEYD